MVLYIQYPDLSKIRVRAQSHVPTKTIAYKNQPQGLDILRVGFFYLHVFPHAKFIQALSSLNIACSDRKQHNQNNRRLRLWQLGQCVCHCHDRHNQTKDQAAQIWVFGHFVQAAVKNHGQWEIDQYWECPDAIDI